jgi:hypothetical protein
VGQELAKIYDVVQRYAGANGRIELAKAVEMSRAKALEIDDTAELIDNFKKTATKIMGKNIDELISG